MHSVSVLMALLAVGTGVVLGATTCTEDIIISQPTPVIDCDVVDANVKVDEKLSGSLSIEGPKQIKKDLTVVNATGLISISSSSINSIGGTMRLNGLQLLSTYSMTSLRTIGFLELINLPQLNGITLGSEDVTNVKEIKIIDTFISSLNDLNIATAERIEIANNAKLSEFNSALVNVNKTLKLTNNGNNMKVKMSMLERAGDVQFRQVKSFDAPILSQAESIKFNDSPELTDVSANNLTKITSSLTFINNRKLNKLSFKKLKNIGGDMTVQNNTALKVIDGFPELETVGNILLGGNFEEVKLPKLKDVKGSATAASTTDISGFCGFFDDLKKTKGAIRGKESCTSNNTNANGAKAGSEEGDKNGAAGMVSYNVALLGMVVFAGFAHML